MAFSVLIQRRPEQYLLPHAHSPLVRAMCGAALIALGAVAYWLWQVRLCLWLAVGLLLAYAWGQFRAAVTPFVFDLQGARLIDAQGHAHPFAECVEAGVAAPASACRWWQSGYRPYVQLASRQRVWLGRVWGGKRAQQVVDEVRQLLFSTPLKS